MKIKHMHLYFLNLNYFLYSWKQEQLFHYSHKRQFLISQKTSKEQYTVVDQPKSQLIFVQKKKVIEM